MNERERSERADTVGRVLDDQAAPATGALPSGGWAVWFDTTGCTRSLSQLGRCA